MIHLPAPCARGATLRLFEALGLRGVRWVERVAGMSDADPATLVCAEGLGPGDLGRMVAGAAAGTRLMVLSRVGVHRDARAKPLRALTA